MHSTSDVLSLARARQALRTAGLPDDPSLIRASSTRNEVFVGEEFVVRVNRSPNQRLRREAHLCRYLPEEVWAPKVVAYGGELGADYLIVRRIHGAPLARSWPMMSEAQRRSAISQLCLVMAKLHRTPTPVQVPRIDNSPYLIDPRCVTPLVPMLVALDELRHKGVDSGIIDDAEHLAHTIGDALADYDQRQLIHGDLTFENLLWDGVQITGVLDFEWCRGAPIDLELDVLLRMCAYPHAHVAPDLEQVTRAADYEAIPAWIVEFLPSMFRHPRLYDRLRLYAMAFDVKDLLANAATRLTPSLGPLHPLVRLADLIEDGGYLRRTMDRLDVSV